MGRLFPGGCHCRPRDGKSGRNRSDRRLDRHTPPIRFISASTHLQLGNERIEVIETPGHSPGGVCYYVPESSFILTGDTLFQGSIGRTDLPGGNHNTLLRSISTGLFNLPDNTVVYPGHGPATTIGKEKRTNPFFN